MASGLGLEFLPNSLSSQLSFSGRPSFNISIDAVDQRFNLSQNPFTLSFSLATDSLTTDAAINTGSARNQRVFINNWTLKIFPDDSGAKGTVDFLVVGDSNFDFSGFMAFNSNPEISAQYFLECPEDNAAIN